MSGEGEAPKKVTPVNLARATILVAAVQFLAVAITYSNLPIYSAIVQTSGYPYAPAGTTAGGSLLNVLLLVLFVFVATLGLVWLLRRRRILSFKTLVFAAVSVSAFLLTTITADSFVYSRVPASVELFVDFAIALALVAVIGYVVFVKDNPWLSTGALAFVGAEVGSYFASSFPPLTALLLPAAFAVYDIYAVFKGPLKALIGTDKGVALVGMSVKAGEFTLGLGDIVFYSMLPSIAIFDYEPGLAFPLALLTILAVDIGVVATLSLLARRRLLPGLPIPMLLGICVLAVAFVL
jgi:Presenilin